MFVALRKRRQRLVQDPFASIESYLFVQRVPPSTQHKLIGESTVRRKDLEAEIRATREKLVAEPSSSGVNHRDALPELESSRRANEMLLQRIRELESRMPVEESSSSIPYNDPPPGYSS
jgi:hypothetical protein